MNENDEFEIWEGESMKENGRKIYPIVILAVALLIAITAFLIVHINTKKIELYEYQLKEESLRISQFSEEVEFEQSLLQKQDESTQKAETQAETEPATKAETKSSNWQTAAKNELFKPADLLSSQAKKFVFCTDTEIQDYVTMRKGPSKEFDIVTTIPNNSSVVVESKSVNGWTLCKFYSNEGWIRTPFLFDGQMQEN